MAEAAGVHFVSIARFETEDQRPSLDAALAIARALGTTVDDLFGDNSSTTGKEEEVGKRSEWVGARAADSSGDRRRDRAVVRAVTDSGRKLSIGADVKVGGDDEGAVSIDVETFAGTWVSIVLDADGGITGYARDEQRMAAARERAKVS